MKSQKKHFSFEVINDENFCVWTKQHRSELIHRAVSTSACTNLAKLSTGMSMYFLKDLKLGPSPVMMLQIESVLILHPQWELTFSHSTFFFNSSYIKET